jgi:hypothetical protein
MKKRLILLMLLIGIVSISTKAYSGGLDGIGIYGNFAGKNTYYGGGLGLTLKFGNFPVLGLEWSLRNGGESIVGISADWWFWSKALGSNFYLYVGVGAYFGFYIWEDYLDVDVALRGVIGLQFFPIKPIELFMEFDPMVTFIQGGDSFYPGFAWCLRLGVRFRF